MVVSYKQLCFISNYIYQLVFFCREELFLLPLLFTFILIQIHEFFFKNLMSIMHSCYYLLQLSNCPIGFYLLLTCSPPFLIASLVSDMIVLSSSYIFHIPSLEPFISLRSPVSFQQRIMFRTQDGTLNVLLSTWLPLLSGPFSKR